MRTCLAILILLVLLAAGTYIVGVRKAARPSCEDEGPARIAELGASMLERRHRRFLGLTMGCGPEDALRVIEQGPLPSPVLNQSQDHGHLTVLLEGNHRLKVFAKTTLRFYRGKLYQVALEATELTDKERSSLASAVLHQLNDRYGSSKGASLGRCSDPAEWETRYYGITLSGLFSRFDGEGSRVDLVATDEDVEESWRQDEQNRESLEIGEI